MCPTGLVTAMFGSFAILYVKDNGPVGTIPTKGVYRLSVKVPASKHALTLRLLLFTSTNFSGFVKQWI